MTFKHRRKDKKSYEERKRDYAKVAVTSMAMYATSFRDHHTVYRDNFNLPQESKTMMGTYRDSLLF